MQLSDFHVSDMVVKILSAIVILVVTALLANLAKGLLSKQLTKIRALHRNSENGQSLAESLGTIVSLVIWLLGLMAILNLFDLTGVLAPLSVMLGAMLAALPRIVGAILVLLIGILLARVVRDLLVTALQAAHVDDHLRRWTSPGGHLARRSRLAPPEAVVAGEPRDLDATAALPTEPSGATVAGAPRPVATGPLLSTMLGQLVFTVIVLVVAIASLQVLGMAAISDPATHMLALILDAIPAIIGALVLLAIGVMIARLVGNLLETVLRGAGLDGMLAHAGIDPARVDITRVLRTLAQVAIILFFAIAATNMLGFVAVTAILGTILELAGKVVFGAAIILAGVFVANLLAGIVTGQTGRLVRIATIVLFVAMGLKFMGLADSIINLAFGALVVGGALAAALAFGLGGRDAAARQLAKMQAESTARTTQYPPL